MGTARVAAVALLAACYQPQPHTGAPCATRADCPTGQDCVAGRCERDGTMLDPDAEVVPGQDAADVDAPPPPVDAAPPPDAPSAWGTPVLIPGIATTGNFSDPTMSADRLSIAYALVQSGNDDIFVGTRPNAGAAFVAVAFPHNSTADDRSPELSADGNALYFTSERAGAELDVYVSLKVGGVWQTPQPVPGLTTAGVIDNDVALSPDGLTAITAQGSTNRKLMIATRSSTAAAFPVPVEATALNVAGNPSAPTLTDGAAAVYFHAGATRDLYVAYRMGTTFTAPQPIAELNTAGRDAAPSINAANNRLVFERDTDLYETTR
jgi:hypothetical protein